MTRNQSVSSLLSGRQAQCIRSQCLCPWQAGGCPVAGTQFPRRKEPFMTTALSLEEVKKRQQKTWSSGDYGRIAWITVPLADALCEAADLRAGSSVLDVATGTGHVALAAARW